MDTTQQIINAIAHEIKYKRKDNCLNHLKTYFQFDPVHYSGNYTENSFTIWRYSNWAGLFYLVVYGSVVVIDNKTRVNLKSRVNIAGLFLATIVFILFFLGFTGFRLRGLAASEFVVALLFSMLPIFAIGLIVFRERQKCLNDISEIIQKVN